MRKLVTVFITVAAALFAACILSACAVPYHAVLLSDVEAWIDPEFAASHKTAGISGEPADPSLPAERTFLVTEEAELQEIFREEIAVTVDFSAEMLVVYTFTTPENMAEAYLKSATREGQQLKLGYDTPVRFGVGDSSAPKQHWFLFKLDRLDVTSAVVYEAD